MPGTFDDDMLTAPCPECEHETPIKVSKLRTATSVTCAKCGREITVDASHLDKSLSDADRAMDELDAAIAGMSKTIEIKL
jgi:transcription elongation factor Elf1